MSETELSGRLVRPIVERLRDWNVAGKITEDDFDRALTTEARALVDHPIGLADWAPLSDIEGLLDLAAEQLGDESGFVDWADEIVESWRTTEPIEGLIRTACSLVDAPGFAVSQIGAMLVRDADWTYEGGRSGFSVRFDDLCDASPKLKSLLGALLAGFARATREADFEVRFDGVDGADLVVFGEAPSRDVTDGESRLHRAALVA